MAACEVCGERDQLLFSCRHCAGQFCTAHQTPGEHLCSDAPPIARIRDQRQSPADAALAHSADQPASESPEPHGSSSALGRLPELLFNRQALIVVAAILVASATVGGFALLGTDLPSRVGADPSGLFDVGAGDPSTATSADELNLTAVEQQVFHRINTLRSERGVAVLAYDPMLAEIAESHSKDMATRNYAAHVSPDGETVSDRYEVFGYDCGKPGELIIATRYGSEIETRIGTVSFRTGTELAHGIVDLWMQSSSHRQALLSHPWEAVGVGIAVTDDNRVYATLNAC